MIFPFLPSPNYYRPLIHSVPASVPVNAYDAFRWRFGGLGVTLPVATRDGAVAVDEKGRLVIPNRTTLPTCLSALEDCALDWNSIRSASEPELPYDVEETKTSYSSSWPSNGTHYNEGVLYHSLMRLYKASSLAWTPVDPPAPGKSTMRVQNAPAGARNMRRWKAESQPENTLTDNISGRSTLYDLQNAMSKAKTHITSLDKLATIPKPAAWNYTRYGQNNMRCVQDLYGQQFFPFVTDDWLTSPLTWLGSYYSETSIKVRYETSRDSTGALASGATVKTTTTRNHDTIARVAYFGINAGRGQKYTFGIGGTWKIAPYGGGDRVQFASAKSYLTIYRVKAAYLNRENIVDAPGSDAATVWPQLELVQTVQLFSLTEAVDVEGEYTFNTPDVEVTLEAGQLYAIEHGYSDVVPLDFSEEEDIVEDGIYLASGTFTTGKRASLELLSTSVVGLIRIS